MKIINDSDSSTEMETANESKKPNDYFNGRRKGGNYLAGFLFIGFGVVLLLKALQIDVPDWLFNWGTLFIAIGVVSGIKHQFRNIGWLIPTTIGVFILLNDYYPDLEISQFVWPIALILIGVFILLKPRKHKYRRFYKGDAFMYSESNGSVTGDDEIEASAIFGAVKRTILSKNFKGGKISSVFGGAKINLMQSEIQGTAVLYLETIMGGTELIVPSNWDVKQEISAVMGGIEDKRPTMHVSIDPNKVLVLKGSVVMGGIEIKSYS